MPQVEETEVCDQPVQEGMIDRRSEKMFERLARLASKRPLRVAAWRESCVPELVMNLAAERYAVWAKAPPLTGFTQNELRAYLQTGFQEEPFALDMNEVAWTTDPGVNSRARAMASEFAPPPNLTGMQVMNMARAATGLARVFR